MPENSFQALIADGDAYANRFCFAQAEACYMRALEEVSDPGESTRRSMAKIRLACLYELWGNLKESTRYVLEAMELLGYPAQGTYSGSSGQLAK